MKTVHGETEKISPTVTHYLGAARFENDKRWYLQVTPNLGRSRDAAEQMLESVEGAIEKILIKVELPR